MRPAMFALLFPTLLCGQYPPRSGYEPPGAARVESLAQSTKDAPANLLTRAERSEYRETGRYNESVELARRLEKASPWVRVVTLGRTPQGRELVMLVVSKDRAFTPEAAAKTGKTVVLVQNGIHAGEIAGKDASAMLVRDIVISKRYAAWLDHLILLVLPVFNADGHERFSAYNRFSQNGPAEIGFRVTAQRLNLNRDYVKADAPEMRDWLRMYTAWLPDLLIDNHVTDGEDHQYDANVLMPTDQDIWPTVGRWSKDRFLPALFAAMHKDGHALGPFVDPLDPNDLTKGVWSGWLEPRFSTGYAAIQNRAGLLVETHSLKSFRTRVWAHYDVMRHTLDLLSRDGGALRAAVRAADAEMSRQLGKPVFLDGGPPKDSVPFTFRGVSSQMIDSPITGGKVISYGSRAADIATQMKQGTPALIAPSMPAAYAIPREWTPVIDLLRLHGVRLETLPAAREAQVEVRRLTNPKWAERPSEGRQRVTFRMETAREKRSLPAGTVLVPANQRASRVAMNILEPQAPDSAVRWGFFNNVFEEKEYFSDYILEPLARQMLERDANLRADFEQRLKSDAKFAADARARLRFFYDRSPYADKEKNLYPVLRVIEWQ